MPPICPQISDIWKRIKEYCTYHHLFYQNYGTGIFLPDQMLMDLLTIPPTTRISSQNIQTLLRDHITLLTDENLGLILDTSYRGITAGYKHMATIEPSSNWIVKTNLGHTFICGFRTLKEKIIPITSSL